jgi:serine/threonine protein kinase
MPSPREPFDPRQPTADFVPAATPQPETVSFLRTDEPTEVKKPATSPPLLDAPTIPGYRITAEIARGGMGRVYAAFDETLDREVAIKTLLPGADAERFVTEAKITARLPHPAIPPVHALGTLPDGTPWLAMKLIHGQTLAELLKDRSDLKDDQPRYIQIFEQIAQAVGFAHSRGIIHRDLKPLNVMVGEFGEVQVMDWGLAKELPSRDLANADDLNCDRANADALSRDADDPSRDRANADDPSRDLVNADDLSRDRKGAGNRRADALRPPSDQKASGQRELPGETPERTAAGTILGTPGYMAPEQARGEAVDRRADVFALGSILATILTGQPAFVGNSKWEILDKSARADLADVMTRLDACTADAELIALCKRCLSAKPEDRPRDGQAVAIEVAAYRASVEQRLQQAETERARAETQAAEQRKRRRVVQGAGALITAVLLAGLAVSLWQMNRAIVAEREAVANERRAEQERDAKDSALKAERQARQQAMSALRFLTDDLVERQLARKTSWSEQDRAFLRQVIQHFEGFAAITANDAESRSIRAEGHFRVATMRYRLGELKEAEESYRAALALRTQLVADFPTVPQYRRDLAASQDSLASLLFATGRPHEAEDLFRVALAAKKQLVADFPTVPDYRQSLAQSHNNFGGLLYVTKRLQEAETEFRSALDLQKQLVKDQDTPPEFSQELATYHHNLGLLLFDMGRYQEAAAEYRAALLLRKRLFEDFPTVPSYCQELAAGHNNLGIVLNATGRPQDAEAEYRAALVLRKQLVTQFPKVPDYAQDVAVTLLNLAILRNQDGGFAEARKLLEEARLHHQAALQANPMNPNYRRSFRHNLVNMCLAFLGLGEHVAAAQEAEELARFGYQPPTDTYDAACYVARCIKLAEADSLLTEAQRKQFAQDYAEQAMKLLRQAVMLGFNDFAHIKSDPDLEPLRSREDFQKFVAELGSNP